MVYGARQIFQSFKQKKTGFLETIDIFLNLGIGFYIF